MSCHFGRRNRLIRCYGVFTGEDGHGDPLFSLGIATVLMEQCAARTMRRLSRAGEGGTLQTRGRPSSSRRPRNTARRELDAIMEARNRAWLTSYADLWDPVRYPGLTGVRT